MCHPSGAPQRRAGMDDTDRKDAAARVSGVTLHSQQYRDLIYLIALVYEKGGGRLTGRGRAKTADVDEVWFWYPQ